MADTLPEEASPAEEEPQWTEDVSGSLSLGCYKLNLALILIPPCSNVLNVAIFPPALTTIILRGYESTKDQGSAANAQSLSGSLSL